MIVIACNVERERKKAKEGGSAEGKSKLYYKTMAGEFLSLSIYFYKCFVSRNFNNCLFGCRPQLLVCEGERGKRQKRAAVLREKASSNTKQWQESS